MPALHADITAVLFSAPNPDPLIASGIAISSAPATTAAAGAWLSKDRQTISID
jgi:hypothetical protein